MWAVTYTTCLWKSWEALRRNLTIILNANLIPGHWRMFDFVRTLMPFVNMEGNHLQDLDITLDKQGITKVSHMWDETTNTWRTFDYKLGRLRGIPDWLEDLVQQVFGAI